MKVSIMQPYFFPYIGYYQMIAASDIFISYENVDYINRGWINRNRIISNEGSQYFTVPLRKVKLGQLINEVYIHDYLPWATNFIKTLRFTYQKAPNFVETFEFLEEFLSKIHCDRISELAEMSLKNILIKNGINTKFINSTDLALDFNGLDKVQKIKILLSAVNAKEIILPPGSVSLYTQEDFLDNGIKVTFMKLPEIEYKQFGNKPFKQHLSIIDVMMFNSTHKVSEMINNYCIQ